ncbi:bromodomain adjacent to zinc finger domain protein 1A [Eupeodes corollae]|uniref:bromodomain adjacent to zinc finger domain protein 1A n=1 Tax=Eupeodes corollae TaxID=290404 RepID=UPI0024937368|nr:bromodomain adjacent to zinc finger domain protein 1A [Eupeodes corollae]
MPICKREGFENFSENNNSKKRNTFHDNEKVFYCETTKQIFRDYEDYFRHVMVINSTIWQCEVTKRENLTYAEAVKSERRALKKREQFKDHLRPIVLLLIEQAQQSSMKTLCRLVYQFIRPRYFINEEVEATLNKSSWNKYAINSIAPTSPSKSQPEGFVYDPTHLMYTVRKVDGTNRGSEHQMPHDHVRRPKMTFGHDSLRMYIEDNVVRVEGILRPKPDSYKKYITDRKLTFAKIFIGNLPKFEPSRIKNMDKKQSTMSKYLTKNGSGNVPMTAAELAVEEAAREERAKNLIKEMERVRKEKEEKQAELERKKAERLAKIDEEAQVLSKKTDDLERFDQKPLPKFQTVTTTIPTKYFGDAIVVNEFMHSFSPILSGNNVFRNKISFLELTRAFTTREVVGPLSDIILILVGTIFGLQQEEESECAVEYARVKHYGQQPFQTIDEATETHEFVKRHFSFKLNQLPLDAHTISEVLRLHLLSSGANVSERAERYRLTYRNGYYSSEDPGLVFRMQQPHVLRALKMYTIYQLPMLEIFRIINTLIAQILSYSSTINLIEERMEATAKAKLELKALVSAERQRALGVEAERKKLVAEYAAQSLENPTEAKMLEEKLNKKVAEMLSLSAREKRKFETQLEKLHSSMFDYMVFLGRDRAYRKYYVLESIPGVFVEHPLDSLDVCLETPPKNVPHLVGCPKGLKEIRTHLTKIYADESKKRKQQKSKTPVPSSATTATAATDGSTAQDNKENKENQAVLNGDVKLNGDATKMEVDGEVEPDPVVNPPEPPTQYELLMCTGDPKNCFVHDPKNPDQQRWAYFFKEEDIDAVINGLNSLGERESQLKDNLITMRELIVRHTKKCPSDMLSMNNTSQFSRFKLHIKNETKKKYNAANFGFPDDHDLNEVMYAMLVDRILQLEMDITSGDLGKLKVKNIEKWREDIQNNTYDPQGELAWGWSADQIKKPFKDPGASLGETLEIDSEDSADEGISLHDSTLLRQCVKNLASALLQIEQGIEQKFMKEPFGVKNNVYDKKSEPLLEKGRERLKDWEVSLLHSTSYSQVFLHLNILHSAIKWQRSTNKSLCAICRRGTDPDKMLLCDECNAGTHMFCMKPKMKTVPEGNWYCLKCVNTLGLSNEPKRSTRKRAFIMYDEENEASVDSSQSSSRRQSRQRRSREEEVGVVEEELDNDDEVLDDEEDGDGDDAGEEEQAEENGLGEEEEEADEDEHQEMDTTECGEKTIGESTYMEDESSSEEEDICAVCSYDGGEISCTGCKSVYHLDCAELKRAPRNSWNCKTCRKEPMKKRKSKQNDSSAEDEDSDQPLVKRARSSTSSGSKRSSVRNSMHDSFNSNGTADDSIRSNNNNNRRRRAGENLPLNSSLLYELLNDIMKNENSWPFLRPVTHSEVPDYHTIIKEPMDFAKVKSKLNMGKYTINEELLKDIELVFKNCDIYNQEGNEIYEAGSALEKFVMQQCKERNLPFQPSDMNRL